MHQGIDVSAPRGTPVYATASGRVVFAGRQGAYGNLVVIDHGNGYETLYAHLDRIGVRRGWAVRRGEPIGRVGRTGRATGYHVHYEIRRDGQPLDPAPFMGSAS